jgi:hypothetical protein
VNISSRKIPTETLYLVSWEKMCRVSAKAGHFEIWFELLGGTSSFINFRPSWNRIKRIWTDPTKFRGLKTCPKFWRLFWFLYENNFFYTIIVVFDKFLLRKLKAQICQRTLWWKKIIFIQKSKKASKTLDRFLAPESWSYRSKSFWSYSKKVWSL